jgi:hypothetical protein
MNDRLADKVHLVGFLIYGPRTRKEEHMKGQPRSLTGIGTQLYGIALGGAVLAGFITGAWSLAFWLAVSPFAVKGLELATARSSP